MLRKVEDLVRSASSLLLTRPAFNVDEKEGHGNFVTDIDRCLQDILKKGLAEICPEAQFIGEEQENAVLTDGPAWIVDPLDGTANFIADYRHSVISVGMVKDKTPVLGVVYQPYTDEMFSAEKGKGAFLNGKPMHVSGRPFEKAIVNFGTSPYDADKADITMSLARKYIASCCDIRRMGSAALDLAYVACGRADVFFEMILRPWDVCAGALLVTESGGVFDMPLSPQGTDFGSDHCILAGSQNSFESAKELLLQSVRQFDYKGV